MRVEGTKIAITEDSEHLVVQLTVQDQDYVEDLRERAERLSKQTEKSQADTDSDSSASDEAAPMIAKVTVENIQDGVRMVFTPAQGQKDPLKQQLEREIQQIRNEDC